MNHIRYVEYNAVHDGSFIFDVPEGHDCWLLVLTHTPALFRVDGSLQEYPAKSAILFPPFSPIYYCACGDRYENDWLRFDSDEEYVSSLPVQGIPFSLPDADYCHNLFQLLTWKNAFPGAHNERITGQLLQLLFSELQEASLKIPGSLSSHYHELVNLRKSIYNSPQPVSYTHLFSKNRFHTCIFSPSQFIGTAVTDENALFRGTIHILHCPLIDSDIRLQKPFAARKKRLIKTGKQRGFFPVPTIYHICIANKTKLPA